MKYVIILLFALCNIAPIYSNYLGVGQDTTESNLIEFPSIYLTANDLSAATGGPSLVLMSNGATHIPAWSLSARTSEQSVAGIVPVLPDGCTGVKIEIVVASPDEETSDAFEDVYRVYLSQMTVGELFYSDQVRGTPVRSRLPREPKHTKSVLLEPYYPVQPQSPLSIRIQREPQDPGDTFTHSTRLIMVKITPLALKFESHVVQDVSGYNSWPMIQAIGDKLVCVYSRGSAHTINEHARAVYARVSVDRGQTWAPETVVANTSGHGEVAIGKGLDSEGAMLLWVRRIGEKFNHDLYRTTDGLTFTKIVTPKLNPIPMQITDVFDLPTVGLMALWFAGNYGPDGHSWGTLTSSDNGLSWKQHVIESDLDKANWPTEQSAVYLGNGKILAIARTEVDDTTTMQSQFQLMSTDYGKTWTRTKTNISDVRCSTPSLMLDMETGLLSNYYYHRGRGVIKRRVVDPAFVFDNPLSWPDAEALGTGSLVMFDAGNVNSTKIGDYHYLAYYSGEKPNTAVLVAETTAPKEVVGQQK